jgi:hypothetical protein
MAAGSIVTRVRDAHMLGHLNREVLMTTFIDATDGNRITSPITLGVKRGDDGEIYGRIIAAGLPEMISTFPNDPPIKIALSEMKKLASSNGVAMIQVLDDERLWDASWGQLHK